MKACLIDFSFIASSNWSSMITQALLSSVPKNPGVGKASKIVISVYSHKDIFNTVLTILIERGLP